MFEGVDFEGTFFVHDDKDDDYVGFVFGFQDKSSFYTAVWKKKRQTYWMPEPFTALADEGLSIKVLLISSSPYPNLHFCCHFMALVCLVSVSEAGSDQVL